MVLNAREYSKKYKCNIQYGLTAAHNVIYIDPVNGLEVEPEYVTLEIRNNIENNKSKVIYSFDVINVEIYPKYYDNPTEYSGYDIALIAIKDKDNILQNMKHIPIKKIDDKHSNIAKIIGYPGKYKNDITTHWLYGMTGKYKIQKQQKLIEYSDINTSSGQSGAPILTTSDNKNTINNIYNNWSNVNIIGIHTGGNSEKNWGTNINKDITDWIITKIPKAYTKVVFKDFDSNIASFSISFSIFKVTNQYSKSEVLSLVHSVNAILGYNDFSKKDFDQFYKELTPKTGDYAVDLLLYVLEMKSIKTRLFDKREGIYLYTCNHAFIFDINTNAYV